MLTNAEFAVLFPAAAESLDVGLVVVDASGSVEWGNGAAQRLVGADLGGSARFAALFTDPTVGQAALDEARSRGPLQRRDAEFRRAGPSPLPVSLNLTHVPGDGDGHFVAFFIDQTARIQVFERLRHQEGLLREAQRVARMGYYLLDIPRQAWTASPDLEAIFGIGAAYPHTVEGWRALMHPDDQDALTAYLIRDVIAGRQRFDRRYRVIHQGTGEARWVHGLGELDLDAAGAPVRMFGVIQDITEQVAQQREREALEAQLHAARRLESIGLLAGGVAHDLNNLLTPILGHAELMQLDPQLSADLSHGVHQIGQAARRARDLVQQLMAFGRRQALRIEVLDLNEVIGRFANLLRSAIHDAIVLDLRLSPAPTWVRADRGQLEQVLMNLAVNARDAMPEGGALVVQTARWPRDVPWPGAALPDEAFVHLRVRDTGVGMPADVQARVFEPFFTTKEPGHGSGLGLSTAYGIVKQHGGDIIVRSEPGRGAIFDVLLPAA